jgi:hypothetical protein
MTVADMGWLVKVTDPDRIRSASSLYYSHADDTLPGPIGTPTTYSRVRVQQELLFHLLFYEHLFVPSANLLLNQVFRDVLRALCGGPDGRARLLRTGAIVPTFRDYARTFPELAETMIRERANGVPPDPDVLRADATFLAGSFVLRPVTFESVTLYQQFADRMRAHLRDEHQMAALQLRGVAAEALQRIAKFGEDGTFGTTLFFDLAAELEPRDAPGSHRLRQLSSVVRHRVELEAFDLEAGIAPEFRPADILAFGIPRGLTTSAARLRPRHGPLLDFLRGPISRAFNGLTEDVVVDLRAGKSFKRFVAEVHAAYSEPDDAIAAERYRRAWEVRTLRVWEDLAVIGGGEYDALRRIEEMADRLDSVMAFGELGVEGVGSASNLAPWVSFLGPVLDVGGGVLSMVLNWKVRSLRRDAEQIRARQSGRLLMETAERQRAVNRSSVPGLSHD